MAEKLIIGSKEEFSIFLKNEDGSAFDLSDYVTGPGDVEICIPTETPVSLTIGSGVSVPTPSNGEIKGSLTATQTSGMEEGTYAIDIVLKPTAEPTNPTIIKLTSALSLEARAC